MKYRITEILAEKTLGASGVETIDIDLVDPISAIQFEYKNTPVSNTQAGHVAACLSKIELVDGADVLFSLSGKQLHALSYYSLGRVPYTNISNAIGVQQLLSLLYPFGRKLWDPQLALDTKRFKNPQLKITHNVANSDASATAHTLKVLGYVFDEKAITPSGFLMSKELKSYTPGSADSYEYTDMPTDYALRKMLIQAYVADYQPWQVANEILLSESNDKRVPINEKVSTLMKYFNQMYPRWEESCYAVLTSAKKDLYWTPNFGVVVQGLSETAGAVLSAEHQPMTSPSGLYSSASGNAILAVSGYNPHGVVPIDFGDQDDIEDWYDVTSLGSLKARIKAGAGYSGSSIALVTQQYRKY